MKSIFNVDKPVLRYRCYTGVENPEYPNCGEPESVGNPDTHDLDEDIIIFLRYYICNNSFNIYYYKDAGDNSKYAEDFLLHYGFDPRDTTSLVMHSVDLDS